MKTKDYKNDLTYKVSHDKNIYKHNIIEEHKNNIYKEQYILKILNIAIFLRALIAKHVLQNHAT